MTDTATRPHAESLGSRDRTAATLDHAQRAALLREARRIELNAEQWRERKPERGHSTVSGER
jgi:hypothetical protein